jgi:hypothetical protein
VILLTLEIDSA